MYYKLWKKVYKCKSRWRRETIVCIYYFFFFNICIIKKHLLTYAALDFSLTHSFYWDSLFTLHMYLASALLCLWELLNVLAQVNKVWPALFFNAHMVKKPSKWPVWNGHVEIQTFFPPGPQHINQGNEMNGMMAHEMMMREVPPSSLVGKLVFGITNCQTTQLVVDWPIENLLINIMVH